MYEYISGKIASATAAQVVIDCNGVGYLMEVTLNTYALVKDKESAKLWVHEIVREDAHILYGFAQKDEREMFRLLIGVSGVGAATARVMLSSLSVAELSRAILEQNARLVQGVKGIGAKTAQRIVIELADKMGDLAAGELARATTPAATISQNAADAQAALVMLGFPKPAVEKVLQKMDSTMTVEQMIKEAMKRL